MSVDRAEVARIARLAKLSLTEEETLRLVGDMSRILEHARRLREVVTEARDEEAGHGSEAPGTRDPEAEVPDALHAPPEAFAPDMRDGLFAVPPPPGVTAHPSTGSDGAPASGDEADG